MDIMLPVWSDLLTSLNHGGETLLLFCLCQKDRINCHSTHLAACGLVSGHSHSPQTICGSGMVSGLCLTPRVLIQQFPQTSLNMKYRVKPDSCSKSFPSCGHNRRPRPCLRILSDSAGVRQEDYVCLDFHTISFCMIPHWTTETMDQVKTNAVEAEAGNSHPVCCNNNLCIFLRSQQENPSGEN